ncbi:hypothetical protein Pelo_9009 [Pelomyxa schiedti]|nr:hypothetical protein Pelo_9009 [Pelomyxa schiedti]
MYTTLHLACREGNVAIAKQLLSCVAISTHIKNKEGKTALDSSKNDQVRQAVCPVTTSAITQAVTSPKTSQQQPHPRPPSTTNDPSPSSFTPPKPQPQTATVEATARPTTTMATSKVLPKALDEGDDRDCSEIEVKQLKNDITELKARITQLEEENTNNLNLLHEERKQHATTQQRIKEMKRIYEERETDNQQRFRELQQQWKHNSDMELQSLQEKTVSDMTAKNKELMELEAHITTLEEESAMNLKRFCDERASDQQRFRDLQHYTNHVMSHVEQGEGTWRNILPENNKTNGCKQSQLRVTFEDLPSFDEIVCGSCPLQMEVWS